MPEQQFYPVKLLERKTIARDILEFRFAKPDGFIFNAGQFAQFKIPDGEKFVLRSYSISSPPTADWIELCIKILPDGKASSYFDALPVGAMAEMSAARGLFICSLEVQPSVLVATGTGLAPIISMLETELPKGRPMNLLFGVRSEEDLFWADRLADLKKQHPHFALQITLSQPQGSWQGLVGRVTDHLQIISGSHYYLCGSLPMVKDVRAKLLAANVNTKSIHFEIF